MTSWVPIKHLADINAVTLPERTNPDTEIRYIDISSVGVGRLVRGPERMRFGDAPSRARRVLRYGDTIVSTVRTYLRAVWSVTDPGNDLVASTGFAVISPRLVDARFLGWWLESDTFIEKVVANSVGVSYPAIAPEELGGFSAPVPPLAEQRAIADYLDVETARIDALITKKQQLIHLLEERLRSFRELSLTTGNHGTLTQSRTAYFRSVPIQWSETTLRHLNVDVQTGPFGSQLHADEYVENGWPVVNPANIRDGRVTAIDNMTVNDLKRDDLARHILRAGDIVFGRRGEMGRAALISEAERGWLCGTGSLRLRVRSPRLSPKYLAQLLQTDALRQFLLLNSVGSTMDNLNARIVLSMPALVPPLEEQMRIVEMVEAATTGAESASSLLTRQITLLTERRQALITAAVTGELTVPGAG